MPLLVAAVLLPAAAWQARAASWQGGSGTWDNSDTTHWNPLAVPTTGTAVNLTQSSASPIAINYAATSQTAGPGNPSGTYYGNLTVSNATGPTTLYLDGTDLLPPANTYVDTGGTINISGSATLYSNSEMSLYGGTVTQSGGMVSLNGGNDLNLYPGVGKTATYNLSGGTIQIPGARALEIGSHNWAASPQGTSIFNMSGTSTIMGKVNVGRNDGGPTTLNQTGGNINTTASRPVFRIRADGAYNLSGGSNWNSNFEMEGGSFTQSNGTFTSTYDANICRTPVYTGTLTVAGGTMSIRNLVLGGGYDGSMPVVLGGSGNALLSGGTLTLAGSGGVGIYVSHPLAVVPSTLTLKGTTLAGGAEINVFPLGTFQGYGTVGIGAGRSLNNSGRIIANGYGADRTLDFTSYSGTLSNPTDNASDKGWFAVNHGKLVLRAITVPANGSVNWGESAADTTPDMINSMRITSTTGITAGTLAVSLLSDDRNDVGPVVAGLGALNPPYSGEAISLFKLDPGSFSFGTGSLSLQVRYDQTAIPAAFPISQLGLYLYDGTSWSSVLGSLDSANMRLTSTALTSFGSGANAGFLAITIPEPAGLALLGLGAMLVGMRRRRS